MHFRRVVGCPLRVAIFMFYHFTLFLKIRSAQWVLAAIHHVCFWHLICVPRKSTRATKKEPRWKNVFSNSYRCWFRNTETCGPMSCRWCCECSSWAEDRARQQTDLQVQILCVDQTQSSWTNSLFCDGCLLVSCQSHHEDVIQGPPLTKETPCTSNSGSSNAVGHQFEFRAELGAIMQGVHYFAGKTRLFCVCILLANVEKVWSSNFAFSSWLRRAFYHQSNKESVLVCSLNLFACMRVEWRLGTHLFCMCYRCLCVIFILQLVAKRKL